MVAKPLKDLGTRISVETQSLRNMIRRDKKEVDTRLTGIDSELDFLEATLSTTNAKLDGVDDRLADVEDFLVPKPWLTWVPTFPTASGQSLTGVTIKQARYQVDGKTCHFMLDVTGTVSGPAHRTIAFSLPVPSYLISGISLGSIISQDTANMNVGYMIVGGPNVAWVRKALTSDGLENKWITGATASLYANGTYEIQ